jgi:hypothetical protein
MVSKSIIETKKYTLISIEFEEGYKAGWEELQEEKNKTHNQLTFIEIYPTEEKVVNRANVRHLYHKKGLKLPDLNKLERVKQHKLTHYE